MPVRQLSVVARPLAAASFSFTTLEAPVCKNSRMADCASCLARARRQMTKQPEARSVSTLQQVEHSTPELDRNTCGDTRKEALRRSLLRHQWANSHSRASSTALYHHETPQNCPAVYCASGRKVAVTVRPANLRPCMALRALTAESMSVYSTITLPRPSGAGCPSGAGRGMTMAASCAAACYAKIKKTGRPSTGSRVRTAAPGPASSCR